MDWEAVLDGVRRPEYTGRNRCRPCTVLNVGIAIVCGAVLARRSRPLGLLVAAVGLGLVAVRGYVVPGTPTVAPRLVDPLPVGFGHDGVESDSLADPDDPERVLAALAEAGVIRAAGDELFLDEGFRDAWTDRMAALRDASDDELAARAAAVAAGDVTGEFHGDRLLLAGDRDVWLRRAVAIAETAAAETLPAGDLSDDLRARAAKPLRTLLRTCPVCAGDVRETTLRNCCGGPGSLQGHPEQPVLACEDCETVVATFDQ